MSTAQARARAGKYTKPKRGGGKHFSRNLQPINADGEVENMWGARGKKDSDDDSDGSDESSEEDSEEESDGDGPAKPDVSREERRKIAKERKEAALAKQKAKVVQVGDLPSDSEEESEEEDDDDEAPANPNHTAKARAQTAKPVAPVEGQETAKGAEAGQKKDPSQLSRREREALQAQQAKERYQKMHAEGKTDEARADLDRLKLVKERRAQEAERRKAEDEEKAEQIAAKGDELGERERRLREAAMGTGGKKSGGRGGRKK